MVGGGFDWTLTGWMVKNTKNEKEKNKKKTQRGDEKKVILMDGIHSYDE